MSKDKGNENRDQDGAIDHPVVRSPEGQGNDAPFAKDSDHAEYSIFDGAGNESVVTVTRDENGNVREGTGATSEEALKNAKKLDQQLGDAFGPVKHS
ncbi:MAG TPA: hypothetical protein VM121_01655 [Acidimicrobiales bacterium]|nr:hypothetical protein [Acidimicrobiales bacterium]